MNDSTSQTSPGWPTHWPKGSFSPLWTIGFIILVTLLVTSAVFATAVAMIVLAPGFIAAATAGCANLAKAFAPNAVVQIVAEAVIVPAILIAMPRLSKFPLRELGFRAVRLRDLGFVLLGVIGMIAVGDIGGSIGDTLAHAKEQEEAVQIFVGLHDPRTLIFFGVFANVLAPIFEEMVFRVFLFNLVRRYAGFWTGALVSGSLFGLAHWDPCGTGAKAVLLGTVVPLALAGVVLAWVYERSRNAYVPMITHGVFNVLSTTALYFAPKLVGG